LQHHVGVRIARVERENRHLPALDLARHDQRRGAVRYENRRPADSAQRAILAQVDGVDRHAQVARPRIVPVHLEQRPSLDAAAQREEVRAARRVHQQQIAIRQRVGQPAIKHKQVEVLLRQRLAGRRLGQRHAAQTAENLAQEDIVVGHQQHAPRPAPIAHGIRHVIDSQVIALRRVARQRQARGQRVEVFGQGDVENVDVSLGGDRITVSPVDDLAAVDIAGENHVSGGVAVIADAGEQLRRAARQRRHRQRRDRQIARRAPHRHEAHVARHRRQIGRQPAIAHDHDLQFVHTHRARRREGHGGGPVRADVARLGGPDRVAQHQLIARGGGQHFRHVADLDHGHRVVGPQRVDHVQPDFAGSGEAARLDVGGLHAG